MDTRRKELIRNIMIAIAVILLIGTILFVTVRRNNGSNYTDVNRNNSQVTETNSGDDSENGGSEDKKIDVDNLPKVPVEPAP